MTICGFIIKKKYKYSFRSMCLLSPAKRQNYKAVMLYANHEIVAQSHATGLYICLLAWTVSTFTFLSPREICCLCSQHCTLHIQRVRNSQIIIRPTRILSFVLLRIERSTSRNKLQKRSFATYCEISKALIMSLFGSLLGDIEDDSIFG